MAIRLYYAAKPRMVFTIHAGVVLVYRIALTEDHVSFAIASLARDAALHLGVRRKANVFLSLAAGLALKVVK